VMSESNDKVGVKKKPKEPPEYRRFKALLRKVIKAPPMEKSTKKNTRRDSAMNTETPAEIG